MGYIMNTNETNQIEHQDSSDNMTKETPEPLGDERWIQEIIQKDKEALKKMVD